MLIFVNIYPDVGEKPEGFPPIISYISRREKEMTIYPLSNRHLSHREKRKSVYKNRIPLKPLTSIFCSSENTYQAGK